ncbi:YbaB/EbfC DNA-binding family protein [Streptomyces sp. KhCrAH-43]|uniref:YbaB/EbfC family nucleoid-associated protein n=1 Tax=Streptomyces TaxID=1883 RepID=UPI000381304A|nr:YbaB/EbfC family nucleoid-associated protein [Streptomyces sp. KhCrAH-43]MYS36649.1 YbaB/EbfC family DNA-binding protein [Streptomyces sp. SID4920]MYX69120.1 YbaB/EbfC family DNA-binding protein [Streptomyces sp. SID8373]RAJ61975.1 YbaB/EbfC DNA-binding family protein [Streptomyces sp. KhCrAH-43]
MNSESIEQRLARAMAELEETEAAVARAESELAHAEATVRSADRSVEVTVSAQGDMTALTFLDDKYRTMPAGQLAASVLEAAQEARARMARRVMSTFEPFTHANAEAPELTGFDVDWNKIFGPGVLEGPKADRRRGSGRLRDEISEDPED